MAAYHWDDLKSHLLADCLYASASDSHATTALQKFCIDIDQDQLWAQRSVASMGELCHFSR